MPRKDFGDGVFPKETPSKPQKPRFLGLWQYTFFSTLPWGSSNIWRGDAGYLGRAYKEIPQNSRTDYLRECLLKGVLQGVETPITPDEPDVLGACDGVEGLGVDDLVSGSSSVAGCLGVSEVRG